MSDKPNTEVIAWQDAASLLPDSDTTVLVCTPKENEPVQLGYHDGEAWRDFWKGRIHVTYWANVPKGPS
jgi:hypothetical protein